MWSRLSLAFLNDMSLCIQEGEQNEDIFRRIILFVVTSTPRYKAVRVHRTGSNNSGRKITSKTRSYTMTETNRTPRTKIIKKNVRSAYVRIKVPGTFHMIRDAAETETMETA